MITIPILRLASRAPDTAAATAGSTDAEPVTEPIPMPRTAIDPATGHLRVLSSKTAAASLTPGMQARP